MSTEILPKESVIKTLQDAFQEVVETVNNMTHEQFLTSRPNDNWSPAQILGHLILSTKPINKALSTPKLMLKTAFGKNKSEERSLEQLIHKYKDTLSSGLQAPSNFIFDQDKITDKEQMISKFNVELDKLVKQIHKWKEKDLSDYVLPHPAIGKLTIREMLLFTAFHTRHHHKQMKEVL